MSLGSASATTSDADIPASGASQGQPEPLGPRYHTLADWVRWVSRSPYLAMSVAVLAFACLTAYRAPWKNDFGLHAGVVERLRQDLWSPADPMVDAHAPNPYFTPYTLLLGLISRITGWSAIDTLRLVAPVGVALFLYGFYRFVRVFTDNRWAPVAAFSLMLLLWGKGAPSVSGFLNLIGLPLILAYPSTVALALTLTWWAYLWRSFDRPNLTRWALLGAGFGVIAIVHSFTAVDAALGALALSVGRIRSLRAHLVAAALVVSLAEILAWPYYSVVNLTLSASNLNAIHRDLYVGLVSIYAVPLVLCIPAFALRLRRNRSDPLVLLFLFSVAVVLAGWVTKNWALGRALPMVMLSAQVTLGIELTSLIAATARTFRPLSAPRMQWRRAVTVGAWAVVIMIVCASALGAQSGPTLGILRVDRHLTAFADREPWVTSRVAAGEVVLLDINMYAERWLARDLLGHGVLFVEPPWPDPLLPDQSVRHRAARELLAAHTTDARRRELLDHYHVRWIVDTGGALRWADAYARETIPGPDQLRLVRIS